jgi:hypothetical protein
MSDLIAQTRSVLATSADRWAAITRIDGDLLGRRPAPGEWSAFECLAHVVDTELAVFEARVRAILDGQDFAGFDPDTQGMAGSAGETAPELAARLAAMRATSLETLGGLVPSDLPRTARHADLGVVTMAELLNEWAAHDTMHIVQAERALMQAFIPGSGPWRPFFTDHDVDAPGR